MKTIFAREAIEDLVAIGEYIAASNPTRAADVITDLEEKRSTWQIHPLLSNVCRTSQREKFADVDPANI